MKTATLIIGIIQLVRLLSVDGDIIDLDNETIVPKSLGESTYDSRPPHPIDVAIQKQFYIYKVRKWGQAPYPEFDDALWQLLMASHSENIDYKKEALDKFLKYDKEQKNERCKADLKSTLIQYEKTQRKTLAVKRAAINRKPICKF